MKARTKKQMSNENPLANLNWRTILSSFDDPITLLQWLKKIVEEQGTQTIQSLDIETVETGKVKFVITMDNGDTIESDTFTYVTPSALNTAIVSCLSSAKDYTDEKVATKSVVSGTNDGTNWLTITIDGTTYAIPAGGGGSTVWGQITGTLSSQTDLKNALDDKLDKRTTVTTYHQAYIKNAGGTQSSLDVATGSVALTIPLRTADGTVRTEAPSVDKDAANKKYVDDRVAGTNDGTNWTSITIGSNTYNIPSGGGTHLYRHNIRLYSSGNYDITFTYISNSDTAITSSNIADLFPSGASRSASGGFKHSTRPYSVVRITRGSATEFTVYGIGGDSSNSYEAQDDDFTYAGTTVTDVVETIL